MSIFKNLTIRSFFEREKYTFASLFLNVSLLMWGRLYGTKEVLDIIYWLAPTVTHMIPVIVVSLLMLYDRISKDYFVVLLGITRGYMLYGCWVLFLPPFAEGWVHKFVFLLHHVLFFMITYCAAEGPKYVARGILAEIASIPLHYVQCFGYNDVMNNTLFFKGTVVILIITYFIFRVLNFSDLFYRTVQDYKADKIEGHKVLLLPPLWLMNVIWFCLIVHKAILHSM